MLATGKMQYFLPNHPTEPNIPFGMELSGLLGTRRVMCILRYKGIGLQCKSEKYLTWDIPDHWNLEEAATVPLVYATVGKNVLKKTEIIGPNFIQIQQNIIICDFLNI